MGCSATRQTAGDLQVCIGEALATHLLALPSNPSIKKYARLRHRQVYALATSTLTRKLRGGLGQLGRSQQEERKQCEGAHRVT